VEAIITVIILAAAGTAIYKHGKRVGSKQGYWVGRHGRTSKR